VDFILTLCPNKEVISQNSQEKGHPLDTWIFIKAYCPLDNKWKSGTGVDVISGKHAVL
jgi:hypothetical protein